MKRIFLVRHGESMANADPLIYKEIAGHKIPLTETGIQQAKNTGIKLNNVINNNEKTKILFGKSLRIQQTTGHILDALRGKVSEAEVVSALKEMDLGLFYGATQHELETELKEIGDLYEAIKLDMELFYTKTPEGESPEDVYHQLGPLYTRITNGFNNFDNYIIVSSGISLRVLYMIFSDLTPEEYAQLSNPENASAQLLEADTNSEIFTSKGYL